MNIKYDFEWSDDKNEILKSERNISFEDIVIAMDNWGIVDTIKNKSSNHEWQFCYLININSYIYVVPFVKEWNKIFLKTIFPDRKYTKIYFNKN